MKSLLCLANGVILASIAGTPLACAESVEMGDSVSRDRITLPAVHQSQISENKQFEFVVESPEGWPSQRGIGKLYRRQAGQSTLLWQQALPQTYGPRFMVVGNQGQVLLLDEFINVASPYAVMLINAAGETVAQHRFESVATTLAVPAGEIVAAAHYGWWISAAPRFEPRTNQVKIETAGKTLMIDLTTGQLHL